MILDHLLERFLSEKYQREVTDKDRERAKEKLSDQLSDFVDPEVKKQVTALESALIDGDLKAFAEGLKGMKPEQLKKFVEGLNKQFDKAEVSGGIDLQLDSSGNVLLYEENGYSALSIDPKTGEATVKPIDVRPDGSVVLQPGEVINRDADDVMSGIADEATRSLTRKQFRHFPPIKPRPPIWKEPMYKDGGGAGRSILEGLRENEAQQLYKKD